MPDENNKSIKAPPPITTLGNGPSAHRERTTARVPDWDFWLHMPHAEAWTVCALSLNIDPDSMEHINSWMSGPGGGPFFEPRSFPSKAIAEQFDKRLRLLSACITNPAHFRLRSIFMGNPARCEIHLADFARWATSEMKWADMPAELVALAQTPDKSTTAKAKAAPAETTSIDDWKEQARKIADEVFDDDARCNCRRTLRDYAARVMDLMQERGIKGPRGIIDNSNTIMREALQGDKWWAIKSK